MANPLYPTFAFLGFVLVLIPLPWHLHAWNAGTCLFIIWTALGCLIHFINSLVWAGNLEIHSVPWCDISTKLMVGLSVALPCASLCINRRLYSIAVVSRAYTTKAEKRRGFYIDIAIGVGVPVIVMVLHYIVQGHRFDIFEDIGCWPSTVNMAPSYPLVWIWPVVIGLISMVFCVLSIRAFLRRRMEFNDLLAKNQSLSINRYFRLMALATTEIATTVPLGIYFMYLNLATEPISPWVSWSDTKWHFSRIDFIPAWVVNSNPTLKLNFTLNIWLFPACAFLFFAFFGIAEEARRNYTKLYYWLAKHFGILPPLNLAGTTRKPQKANIVLNKAHTSSFGNSEHGWKWDEHSLSTPEADQQFGSVRLSHPISFPKRESETASIASSQISRTDSPPLPPDATPIQSTSSSSVPALLVTRPDLEAPLFELQIPSTSLHHPPPSPPHSLDYRGSITSDHEIEAPPLCFPNPNTASRHHGQAFLPRGTSDCPPAYPIPHGGVHITVETSVR